MGKLFGICLMFFNDTATTEIYTKGFDGAFGGIFAGATDPIVSMEQVERTQSLGKRVGVQVQSDIDQAHRERMGEFD
jgi:hypothetical protein